MTKREREYHFEKKVWKAFVKLSTEPGGPHYFYDPSLKLSLHWEPKPVFVVNTEICLPTEPYPVHGLELTNSKGKTLTITLNP